MDIEQTPLNGLIIIKPKLFSDDRGYFLESFQKNRYQELGIPELVQDNISHSKQNVLRGLHYQLPYPQGKLIWVLKGNIFDVALDIRTHSPTFGQWYGRELNHTDLTQIYIPPGFAHGFCVLSNEALVYYKCTNIYQPHCEQGVAWNDTDINITWPVKHPVLSAKDIILPHLHEIPREKLFS